MGKIEIIDREWVQDTVFWFALDGPVTFETQEGEVRDGDQITSKYWQIRQAKRDATFWFLVDSNDSKTRNRQGGVMVGTKDTPKEVFCRFTSQIVEYKKPISFSPHSETLKWDREEQ